jgi:hypothetical protein
MTDKLIELAKACEAATGPDREIDTLIGYAVDLPTEDAQLPRYTASLDAALTLVPPWSWRVGNLASGRAFADLGTQKSLQCIEGATPALALCAAALRARAVQ